MPVLALGPLVSNICNITASIGQRRAEWALKVAYTGSVVEMSFNMVIASIIPILPAAKWDHPMIRFFDRMLDKLERQYNRLFKSSFTRTEPSFMLQDQQPPLPQVQTIGSRPMRNVVKDSELIITTPKAALTKDKSNMDISIYESTITRIGSSTEHDSFTTISDSGHHKHSDSKSSY